MKTKKYILLMALAAVALMPLWSCSSDDDKNDDKNTVTLEAPKYEAQAADFEIAQGQLVATASESAETFSLTDICFTEGGTVIFENTKADGESIYVRATNVTLADNVYTIPGIGTVTLTSASTPATFTVNVTFTIPRHGTVKYSSSDAVTAGSRITRASTPTPEEMENYFVRTWNVTGLIVDLKGDVTLFKTFNGGYLKPICDEAIKQGAVISEEEQAQFDKTVVAVDVTRKSKKIFIAYDNGDVDAATWKWANPQHTKVTLDLQEDYMGNKFIVSNTDADLAFRDTRAVLTLNTKITGEKNYDVQLTLQLKDAN